MVSPGFAFVPVDSSGKTQAIDRKTIRSHCMRGKNRRIGVSRRSTTRPTRTSHSLRPVLLDSPSSTITIPCAYQEAEEEDDVFVKTRPESIASFCAPSNIAQVKLAIDMDDTTKALVIDCKHVLDKGRGLERTDRNFSLPALQPGHVPSRALQRLQCRPKRMGPLAIPRPCISPVRLLHGVHHARHNREQTDNASYLLTPQRGYYTFK